MQDQGLSDAEIAVRLGYKNVISVSGLRATNYFHQEAERLAPQLKNPVGKRVRRLTADDHRRIRELHAQGLNNEQIAAAMPEWADSTIYRHIKKLGLRPPRKAPLSDDEKTEIIRLREQEEMSHKRIGIEIGRPESTVSAFCVKHFGYIRDLILMHKSTHNDRAAKSIPKQHSAKEHQRQQSREDTGKSLRDLQVTKIPLPLCRFIFGQWRRVSAFTATLTSSAHNGSQAILNRTPDLL